MYVEDGFAVDAAGGECVEGGIGVGPGAAQADVRGEPDAGEQADEADQVVVPPQLT